MGVVLERPHDGVLLVRLDRPKQLNALDDATVGAVADACDAAGADRNVRAIVLAGNARAFAAGADIAEFAAGAPRLETWDRIWACAVPMIAAVRGLALGGGLELAMSCDLLVVAENARLGQPEINLGVMPGAGGTQRLTRAVGKALAAEMVLLGRELTGREAERRGLATRAVPSEQVEPVALALASRIAAQAPGAVRAAKRALLGAFAGSLRSGLDDERAAFLALLGGAEAREGVAAFLEKRRPVWPR